ncbi:MAG: hypothetical protein DRN57_05540 [Thermoplasmata archaeon]|nr:MAG: hypothetical protein DRN57_05540 [Thermoplasmata archaeon]
MTVSSRKSAAAATILLGLFALAFILLPVQGIVSIGSDIAGIDVESNSGYPLLQEGSGNGELYDQKEVPMEIQDITFIPFIQGRVYPHTPVVLRTTYSCISPERIIVFPVGEDPNVFVVHYLRNNTFHESPAFNGLISLDKDDSRSFFNSSTGRWETDLHITFRWSMEGDTYHDLSAVLESTNQQSDRMDIADAYYFENDITVKGEPRIDYEDLSYVSPNGYLKGGTFIEVSGMSVTFEGTDIVHPDPDDLILGVTDSLGNRWEYLPFSRNELSDVHFSFMVPMTDGRDDFTFKVLSAPSPAVITGEGWFSYILDSKFPVLGDMKVSAHGPDVVIDLNVEEEGSGLDLSSLEYRLEKDSAFVTDWIHPEEIIINGTRIEFEIRDLERSDYNIHLKIMDQVGNGRSEPKVLFFTTIPSNLHDIRLSTDIEISMDPVIENNRVYLNARVDNLGTSDECDVYVDIMDDGELYDRKVINSLPAGSSREVTWSFVAGHETSTFTLLLDPMMSIPEDDRSDNSASISLNSEYRDLAVRSDYIIPSDWDAKEGDVITLSFQIMNIGSIHTDQFKVRVSEDDTFLGQYVLGPLAPDSSHELVLDWVVNSEVTELTLMIDPFGEIIESVENNNVVGLANPFFHDGSDEGTKTGEENEGSAPVAASEESEKERDPPSSGSGMTIWSGPTLPVSEEPVSSVPSGGEEEIVEPPMNSDDPSMLPLLVPSLMISISLITIAGILALIRMEPFRYRWLLLMVPLYSKLKSSGIEKGVRFEILGYLKARPGANYSELKRNLDLNDGTLVHHLRVLEREEKIYSKKMGKFKLFYPSSYRRQALIDEYISPFHKRILEIISDNPGIVPKKLSSILDRSQSDISYHISELSRNGYLEKRRKGRSTHLYINSELLELLSH